MVSDSRILVVTVGTSLFSSASWLWEGDLKTVPGYRGWIGDQLEDPAGRRRDGAKTIEKLENFLGKGTEVSEKCFASDFDHPLRYSGELTTLLRCYTSPLRRQGGRQGESFSEYLQRRYGEIQLLAATKASNLSNIAARHLQVILRDKIGHPNVSMPQALRHPDLYDLVGCLRDHLEALFQTSAEVDLLVTGGYKAYSLLAGKFVATQPDSYQWRALYLHEEEKSHLVIETKDATEIDEHTVLGTGWPTRVGKTR